MRFQQRRSLLLAMILSCLTMPGCDDHGRGTSEPKQYEYIVSEAPEELKRMRAWVNDITVSSPKVSNTPALLSVARRLDEAILSPKQEAVAPLRQEVIASVGSLQGGDGAFAIGVTHSMDKVFIDEPFRGRLAGALEVSLARNESEGAQLVVLSAGKEVKNISVGLEGRLSSVSRRDISLPMNVINIQLIGYVDTTTGERPYHSPKLGWWPDPLLPNRSFDVLANEAQSLLVTVTTTDKTFPGVYTGKIIVRANGKKSVAIPLKVTVYNFTLPAHGHYATFALGSGADNVTNFYGGDPGGKIMERFVREACRRHMPPIGLINGWGWKTPKAAKMTDGSYDFTSIDRWLEVFKAGGVTRFPMAIVPRFRKFGGGEYTEEFKREFGSFVKAYSAHLKEKGLYDAAVLYNIDEASNDPKLQEWEVCKELYHVVKQAAPDLPVVQCLNEPKGVRALAGHADIWDLYFGQYVQARGPERLAAGDQIMLSVCIWPSDHPNLFIEYPLLDARIMPWIAFRVGATGFEYWEMFASWKENLNNKNWWEASTRTSWKLGKPHGDGLLMYPGPGGKPLSSLRLEALRDGIEDYEYLVLLSNRSKNHKNAAELLKEAIGSLVSGPTSYVSDPLKLLDLRHRTARVLEK